MTGLPGWAGQEEALCPSWQFLLPWFVDALVLLQSTEPLFPPALQLKHPERCNASSFSGGQRGWGLAEQVAASARAERTGLALAAASPCPSRATTAP